MIFDNLSYFLLRQEAINLRNQELDIVKSKVEVSQKQIAQLIENSQQQTNKLMRLKELRNRILRTILTWSLFSLIRLYVGLHFLQFRLEN